MSTRRCLSFVLYITSLSLLMGSASAQVSNLFFEAPSGNTAPGPDKMTLADFNHDGRLDIATANFCSVRDCDLGTLSILLGNGDGTFKKHVDYGVGPTPEAIVAGDFNGDGNPDLAVLSQQTLGLSIFIGNGNGSFQTPVNYQLGDISLSVVAADLNGDHKLDLAVACSLGHEMEIFLGNGDGTFQSYLPFPAGFYPLHAAIGDFNRDHKPDIAVTDFADAQVNILIGNGDGTFQPFVSYETGGLPTYVAVNDFNDDGVPDLAVAVTFPFAGGVSILLGRATGIFHDKKDYAAATSPQALA